MAISKKRKKQLKLLAINRAKSLLEVYWYIYTWHNTSLDGLKGTEELRYLMGQGPKFSIRNIKK